MNQPLPSDGRPEKTFTCVLRMFQQNAGGYLSVVAVSYLVLMPILLQLTAHAAHMSLLGSSHGVDTPAAVWQSLSGGEKIGFLLGFVLSIWLPSFVAAYGICQIASDQHLNATRPSGKVFAEMAAFIPAAFVYGLLAGIPAQLTVTCMVVPSVLVVAAISLIVPAAVAENAGVFAAIRRNFSLIQHVFSKAFASAGLYAILLFTGFIVLFVANFLWPAQSSAARIGRLAILAVPAILGYVLLQIRMMLLYFEARERAANRLARFADGATTS